MKQPFEGDSLLEPLIDMFIKTRGIDCIVETGTETGATTNWFAERVAKVYTCDLEDKTDRPLADNVSFSLCPSHRMLDNMLPLYAANHKLLLYLDAHVAPKNSAIHQELEVIACQSLPDCVIVIHDFQVPGYPELGYDVYDAFGALNYQYVQPWIQRIFPGGHRLVTNTAAVGAKRGVGIFHAS